MRFSTRARRTGYRTTQKSCQNLASRESHWQIDYQQMVLTFWRLVSPCLVDSSSFQLEMEGSHWWKIEWPSCLRGGSCNVSGDINGAFVKMKDSLGFGLWNAFFEALLAGTLFFAVLPCTFDGFGFTAIVAVLAVMLGRVKSIVSGVEAVLPWWGWTILTVHDSDAIIF